MHTYFSRSYVTFQENFPYVPNKWGVSKFSLRESDKRMKEIKGCSKKRILTLFKGGGGGGG